MEMPGEEGLYDPIEGYDTIHTYIKYTRDSLVYV